MKDVVQNVLLTVTVALHYHVFKTDVKIRVQEYVHLMGYVKSLIMYLRAIVCQDLLGILIHFVRKKWRVSTAVLIIVILFCIKLFNILIIDYIICNFQIRFYQLLVLHHLVVPTANVVTSILNQYAVAVKVSSVFRRIVDLNVQ